MKTIKMQKTINNCSFYCKLLLLLMFSANKAKGVEPVQVSNIVASVAGYRNTLIHGSGNEISLFSTDLDKDINGILFYIIYPTNLAGNVFFLSWTNQFEFFETEQKAYERYKLGKLYIFKQSTPEVESIIQNNLFLQVKKANQALLVDAKRYIWSKEEKIEYIDELNTQKLKKEKELVDVKKKLDEELKRLLKTGQSVESMSASQTSRLRKYRELVDQIIPCELRKIDAEIQSLGECDYPRN